jgi:hypothetical protein
MKLKGIFLSMFVVLGYNSIAQQTDMSLIPYRMGSKWGYASPGKQVVIKPAYDEANWFSEGLASVRIGKKYGYINKEGKLVIPARYTVAKSFRKGYVPKNDKEGGDSILFAGASLTPDGYEICINSKGIRLPKCPAINENSVMENNIPVETVVRQKNYSVPNSSGLFDKIVDDYKIEGSDETYYVAIKNNQFGVFNTKFETIVPFQYDSIKVVRNTGTPYLEVNKGGLYGIMLTDGKIAIAPESNRMVTVNTWNGNQYVIIHKNGKTYVKDLKNNDIIATGYNDIIFDNGGFIIVDENNLKGYYFMDNTVIKPKYKEVNLINGTKYLLVKTPADKVGYINSAGDEYFVE